MARRVDQRAYLWAAEEIASTRTRNAQVSGLLSRQNSGLVRGGSGIGGSGIGGREMAALPVPWEEQKKNGDIAGRNEDRCRRWL